MAATVTRRLVSLADTADALAVSSLTVRRYIVDGQLEAARLGRRRAFCKVRRHRVNTIGGSAHPHRSGGAFSARFSCSRRHRALGAAPPEGTCSPVPRRGRA